MKNLSALPILTASLSLLAAAILLFTAYAAYETGSYQTAAKAAMFASLLLALTLAGFVVNEERVAARQFELLYDQAKER